MSAVYVGTFTPGTPEWREHRKTRIGGSDLAAILGLSKWQSAYSLFYERRGDVQPPDEKPQMTWGTLLEPVIAQHYADQHPEVRVAYEPGSVWAHPDRPWQVVSPDARIIDPAYTGVVGGLECKTSRFDYDWADGVPDYYAVQAQWAMSVFDVPTWQFAVLFGGSDYREYTCEASAAVQEALIETAAQFLDDLATGRIPPLDGHETTYATVRALHPDIDPDESVEVGDDGRAWIDAMRTKLAAEEAEKESRARVATRLGRAKEALVDGQKIAYRQPGQKGAPPFLKAVGGLLSRAS